jgi:hypothetical protein
MSLKTQAHLTVYRVEAACVPELFHEDGRKWALFDP